MKRSMLLLAGVLCWLTPVAAQAPEQKKATIAYLQSLQMPDGGFAAAPARGGDGRPTRGSLRGTSGALRALKYFGGEPRDRTACARFVPTCFDAASGGFADQPGGRPDVPLTAIGLMALVELKLPVDKYREPAVRYLDEHVKTFEDIRIAAAGLEAVGARAAHTDAWLGEIARMRNADGTYGKGDGVARTTGSAVVAVLRLGGKVENRERVVEALRAGQRKDGGFGKEDAAGSDLETCYRVVRAFHMLGVKPDAERLRGFIARCRSSDGGYGVAPGQPSAVGPTYYASIILHWLAEA